MERSTNPSVWGWSTHPIQPRERYVYVRYVRGQCYDKREGVQERRRRAKDWKRRERREMWREDGEHWVEEEIKDRDMFLSMQKSLCKYKSYIANTIYEKTHINMKHR